MVLRAKTEISVVKLFWVCLLISVAVLAHPQTVPRSDTDEVAQSHLSIADFGLVYSLSNDWVRATRMIRKKLLDGPIELAGSAVAAVRQWKYKPYLLMGQPVAVMTQIVVKYQLQR